MNKLLSLVLMVFMPALALAHEGHVEGMLSGALHSFSITELVMASCAAVIWVATHSKESRVKKAGAVVALGVLGLGFAI